jgi:MoxR-like ATPase
VFDPSAGVDGEYVVGVPSQAPAVSEEAALARKKRMVEKMREAAETVPSSMGYVVKVGGTTFEDSWLYGGIVDGPNIEPIDCIHEAPAGQFGNESEAKLSAVSELSAMVLEQREKATDRDKRKALGDVAESLNNFGEAIESQLKAQDKETKAAEKNAEKQLAADATQTTEPKTDGETSGGGGQEGAADKGAEGKPPRKPRKKKGEPEADKPAEPSLLDGGDASTDGDGKDAADAQSGQVGQGDDGRQNDKPEPGQPKTAGKAPDSSPAASEASDATDSPSDGHGDPDGLLSAFDARVRRVVAPMIDAALVGFVPAWETAPDSPRPSGSAPARRSTATVTMPAVHHEKFDDVLELAKARRNILLIGPSQAGKTTLAEQVATALGLPFHCIGCSIGMTESALKGRLIPVGEGGKFEYQISAMVKAYEFGGVCLVDEIDAGGPDVLVALNAPLSNDWIPVECRVDNPIARRHSDFICIASANTFGNGADRMYVGRQQLDFATLQRFAVGQIEIGYSDAIERVVCPDAALRTSLLNIRAVIDGLNKAAAYSIRRAVSTRFMADAYIMQQEAGWDTAKIMTQLICGWSQDEVTRLKEGLKAKQNVK